LVDQRATRRRIGEALLMDALRRVIDAASVLGCVAVIVDAKDEDAERFYAKYDFVTVAADAWPRRMFCRSPRPGGIRRRGGLARGRVTSTRARS
jgi:hypothetical protein